MRKAMATLLVLVALAIVLILPTIQQPQETVTVVTRIVVADDGTVKTAEVLSCPLSHRRAVEILTQRMVGSRAF